MIHLRRPLTDNLPLCGTWALGDMIVGWVSRFLLEGVDCPACLSIIDENKPLATIPVGRRKRRPS